VVEDYMIKAAFAPLSINDFDIEHNIIQIENAAIDAQKNGAEILFLGESVLNGFNGLPYAVIYGRTHSFKKSMQQILI
jgi:predicted amidohydrolase